MIQNFNSKYLSINNSSLNFYVSIFYVFVALCFSPLYKLMEVYHDFPKFTLAIVRASILGFVFFLLSSRLLLKGYRLKFVKNGISVIILSFTSILWINFVFLVSMPYFIGRSEDFIYAFLEMVDSVIVGYWMMFFAGFYLDKGKKWKIIFSSWLVFVFILIFNFDVLFTSFITFERSETINYILLSDSFAFLSIILIFETRSKPLSIFFWFVTFFVLFLIPSRTTFVCFIIGTFFTFLFKPDFLKWMTFVSLGVALSILSFGFSNNLFFESNRILSTDLDADKSLQARTEIKEVNYERFKNSWVLGDFMGDYRQSGRGYYTHSYFSLWEQFGLIPFILFFLSVLLTLYQQTRLFPLIRQDGEVSSTLALTIFTLIAISFSRSFFNGFVWFLFSRIYVLNSKKGFIVKGKIH